MGENRVRCLNNFSGTNAQSRHNSGQTQATLEYTSVCLVSLIEFSLGTLHLGKDAVPTAAALDSKLFWLSGSLISQVHGSFTRKNEGHRDRLRRFVAPRTHREFSEPHLS